jgi:hypothetical protein
MADDVGTLPAGSDGSTWAALDGLAQLPEIDANAGIDRRRFLLLASDSPEIHALDRELRQILRMELALQLGVSQEDSFSAIPGFQRLLDESPAFGQYLKTHLLFGVRFAGGRIANPCKKRSFGQGKDRILDDPGGGESEKLNIWPLGLPTPPRCEGTRTIDAAQAFRQFDGSAAAFEIARAFLGDAGRSSVAIKYELWLRDLFIPEPDSQFNQVYFETYFKTLTGSLLGLAEKGREFYLSLEKQPPGAWTDGVWNARNPQVARFAVADLPWLARILRAEVSPDGLVRYGGPSWLHYIANQNLTQPARRGHDPAESVLRGALEFGCDLIRNAVELAADCYRRRRDPEEYPKLRNNTLDWNAVYDEEQEEIAKQRRERLDGR